MLCLDEDIYTMNVPHTDHVTGAPLRKMVSCMNYYYYHMTRLNNFNPLNSDMECYRTTYIHNNQTKLRADSHVHLQDALQSNEHSSEIGQLVILPAMFMCGPTYLHEKTQDSITYVGHHGKPGLFITNM
ncbi:hypothetical protein PR048_021616 [Dryococelus australis]|uniref:Helitron helicase-like domain-containing protein n=1 Tax=Dryococelus australis TaxID=614101 RepID=A0ABQ9GYV1_9NEOP|nr:hypothetical protein PR048_021616 [Dryococelus australis]